MWKIILICIIVGIAAKFNKRYDDYKLFAITPTTEKLLNALHDLKKVKGFRFSETPSLNKTVNILVKPNKLGDYYNLMFEMNAPYKILHYNVQNWIDEYGDNITELLRRSERSIQFSLNRFHTLNEIYQELDFLAAQYSTVQTVVGGRTYENREIKGVKISVKENNPGIFIEGGIYGTQWISTATVMYILHELLTSKNADVLYLTWNYNWYIFPVFNPDGYNYTQIRKNNRFWWKTRTPYTNSCFGADLDKNWCVQWNTEDTMTDPCWHDYPGSAQFSEIEAKSMSEYINSISSKFDAYIAFRCNVPNLHFPYKNGKDEYYHNMHAIAKKAAEALTRRCKIKYSVDSENPKTTCMDAGCTMNYIQSIYDKRLVFQYDLPNDACYSTFSHESHEIIVVIGEGILDSLLALFNEAEVRGYIKIFHTDYK